MKSFPEKITVSWLRGRGACWYSIHIFTGLFPLGAKINAANIRKARANGLSMYWMLTHLRYDGLLNREERAEWHDVYVRYTNCMMSGWQFDKACGKLLLQVAQRHNRRSHDRSRSKGKAQTTGRRSTRSAGRGERQRRNPRHVAGRH